MPIYSNSPAVERAGVAGPASVFGSFERDGGQSIDTSSEEPDTTNRNRWFGLVRPVPGIF